jgi:serine phosphatase RsbU (regulator of sigma subunit)/anti-sigma regulatory factor (Ser/Thr protein kinase)/integral membrane sensor domain MASE1
VAAIYAFGAIIAAELIDESSLQGVFFIPAGLTVAFLLRLPRSLWWVVLLAAGITEFVIDLRDYSTSLSFGYAVGNTVEPLLGAAIVSSTCGIVDLARRRHVFWYTVGAVLCGPALGAAIIAATAGLFGQSQFWTVFGLVWLGDALGVVIVGSVILAWGSGPDRRALASPSGVALVLGSVILTVIVLTTTDLPVAFSVMVGVVLAGAFFGVRAVTMTSLAISLTLGVLLTTDPGDLIIGLTQGEALVLLKLQVGVFALSGLLIAAEANERELAVTRASTAVVEAQALDRARRREHDLATRVQRGLLPDRPLRHPGAQLSAHYEAASELFEVGGDWYDSFELNDGRIGLVVGDIVGHGMDAMISMGRLRTALGALALRSTDPATALTELDEFVGGPDGTAYTTVFYAIVDLESMSVEYSSAGHPHALLMTESGLTTWLDQGQSEPLTGDRSIQRRNGSLEFEAGAVLILYSDGLVERRGESLQEGMELLRQTAIGLASHDAEEMCRRLFALLDDGEERNDDVVVLVMKTASLSPSYRQVFPATPEELYSIRSSIRAWLDAREVAESTADDILIAVGEATANVIRHAYRGQEVGDVEVRMSLKDSRIDVEVADRGQWQEPHKTGDRLGIGTELIRRVSDGMAVHSGTEGTVVSFGIEMSREA